MASENLNSFITLYKEKAQLSLDKATKTLEKRQGQLETFNTLRPLLLEEAKSLDFLEDFERLFPENGDSPFFSQSDLNAYVGMLELVDDSKQLKAFYKISRAPKRLETAKEYLKYAEADLARDPEEYLGKLHGALIGELAKSASMGAGNIDSLKQKVFEDQDSYEDIIEYAAENVDGPRGVKTNPATYAALKELVNSSSNTESADSENIETQEVSPINEEDSTNDVDLEKESSAINETEEEIILEEDSKELAEPIEEPEVSPETVVESSGLDIPEEKEEVLQEIEEPISEPSPVESPPSISSDSPVLQETDDDKELESKSINEVPIQKAEELPSLETTEVVNNITNIDNISEDSTNTTTNIEENTGDINTNTINDIKKPITTSGEGTIYQQAAVSGPSSFLNSFLQDITGMSNEEMNAITNMGSSVVNNMSNESNIENINTTAMESSIGDSIKESNISSINQVENITGGISSAMDETKSLVNNNISENFEKNSNFSSFEESSIIKPEPITKEDIGSVGKDISSEITSTMSLSSGDNEPTSSSNNSIMENSTASSTQPAMNKASGEGDNVMIEESSIDTATLEKRLKNIEILLMGPLEVKIKN